MHIATFQFPVSTPDTSSAASVLGWVVAILVAGIGALWLKHEKDKASGFKALVDSYADQVKKLEAKIVGLEDENRDLHDHRLADERRAADEAKRMARMLLRQARALPPDSEPPDDDEFRDIPTGVAVEVVKHRTEEPRRAQQKSRPAIEVDQRGAVHKPRPR